MVTLVEAGNSRASVNTERDDFLYGKLFQIFPFIRLSRRVWFLVSKPVACPNETGEFLKLG